MATRLAVTAAMGSAGGRAVVGTGTPESCTEPALDAALAGGHWVTFDCGPDPVTITITSTKSIVAAHHHRWWRPHHHQRRPRGRCLRRQLGRQLRCPQPDHSRWQGCGSPPLQPGRGRHLQPGRTDADELHAERQLRRVRRRDLNAGTATLTGCTLSGNAGGGIWNEGLDTNGAVTLNLENCTLNGNSAARLSHGPVFGSGITNLLGTVALTNCTLSENGGRS